MSKIDEMFAKATHFYAAKFACGCYCAVATDVPDPSIRKDTAKDIAGWIRRGATVDRLTFAEWRAIVEAKRFGHTCDKKPAPKAKRANLFDMEAPK